jgi:uncharacterized membrane protein YphA (DoxX/SURF4 family)
MAVDRQGIGLALLRICIGTFFVFESFQKVRWLVDSSILANQFAGWSTGAQPGSITLWYLHRVAIPGVVVFARLVPVGEFCCGLALIAGLFTPVAAFVAFFMALNFQLASGVLFKYSFLTSGYGLPVLGSTLALAIGGVRLPISFR